MGLSNWQFSSEAIRVLALIIEENTALKELYLYSHGINEEGGILIAKILKTN